MNIKEIRKTIDRLNWNRHDATGGTREENKKTNLPAILAPRIAEVQALEIPARFVRDIESRRSALEFAANSIVRWNENRGILIFHAAA